MISDTNKFVFLSVPIKWTEIYNKLLILMANRGIDMIKDCNAACNDDAKRLIQCWNEFNAACAAYKLGQETEAKILIEILIDCMNRKYRTNYDAAYYTNFDISSLSYINCNNVSFFTQPVDHDIEANSFDELITVHNLDTADKLKTFIDNTINQFLQEYERANYSFQNTKYITGDEYLITEDTIYDDLYIIRMSKNYKLKKISYNGALGENIIYDKDNNINNNLYKFETEYPDFNLYFYYNNDKTFVKNIKIELSK